MVCDSVAQPSWVIYGYSKLFTSDTEMDYCVWRGLSPSLLALSRLWNTGVFFQKTRTGIHIKALISEEKLRFDKLSSSTMHKMQCLGSTQAAFKMKKHYLLYVCARVGISGRWRSTCQDMCSAESVLSFHLHLVNFSLPWSRAWGLYPASPGRLCRSAGVCTCPVPWSSIAS